MKHPFLSMLVAQLAPLLFASSVYAQDGQWEYAEGQVNGGGTKGFTDVPISVALTGADGSPSMKSLYLTVQNLSKYPIYWSSIHMGKFNEEVKPGETKTYPREVQINKKQESDLDLPIEFKVKWWDEGHSHQRPPQATPIAQEPASAPGSSPTAAPAGGTIPSKPSATGGGDGTKSTTTAGDSSKLTSTDWMSYTTTPGKSKKVVKIEIKDGTLFYTTQWYDTRKHWTRPRPADGIPDTTSIKLSDIEPNAINVEDGNGPAYSNLRLGSRFTILEMPTELAKHAMETLKELTANNPPSPAPKWIPPK